MYGDPDERDHPDTNPFEFEYPFGDLKITVEAKVSDGELEILECKIGSERFEISDIGYRQFREFEYTSLENCIIVKAWEYLEASR